MHQDPYFGSKREVSVPIQPGLRGIMVTRIKKGWTKHSFLLRASTTQSRLSIWGQKLGRTLTKKLISIWFSIPGFHCLLENNKVAPSAPPPRGGALRAPPLWVFVVFHLAVEAMNRKHDGNQFFIKVRPNFWPQIDNRLWAVLALNKKLCFFFHPFLLGLAIMFDKLSAGPWACLGMRLGQQ